VLKHNSPKAEPSTPSALPKKTVPSSRRIKAFFNFFDIFHGFQK
jgi:hypothetical protein